MHRFHHVLVATDFSANASAAIDWAIRVAGEQHARMTILHVLERIPASTPPGDIRADLLRSLDEVEQTVKRAEVDVASVYRPGRAWQTIVETARELEADLVVIGARGRSTLASLIVGGTADRVVRMASVPVLTVHPDDRPDEPPRPRVALVAIDFSDQSRTAAELAESMVTSGPGPGRLALLHAWQPLVQYEMDAAVGVTVNPLDDTEQQAQEMLETLAATFRERGVEAETMIRQGYPANVIRREAKALDATFIALGTHGRSGLEHFMLGSVAERVLRQAPCPVLTTK